MLLQLRHPKLCPIVRRRLCDVEDEQCNMSAVVVQRRQRRKLLLAGRVPDFELERFAFDVKCLR